VGFLAGPAEVGSQICDVKIVSCVSTPEFAEHVVHEMLLAGQTANTWSACASAWPMP